MNVKITWTAEEALAAEESLPAGSRKYDRTGPFMKWSGLHELEGYRKSFEKGEKRALLAAIQVCARHDLVMPDWVAVAFIRSFNDVVQMRMSSWDDAFGRPFPKGIHLKKARQRRLLRPQVYVRIRQILDMDPDTPIDEGLFERVGEEFGIGKTLANELWYEMSRR